MFTQFLDSDRDAFVYHYTTARKAIDLILPRRRLLLGNYGKTNDPKETKDWTFVLAGLSPNEDYFSIEEHSRAVSQAIKKRSHIFCASADGPAEHAIAPEAHSRGFGRPRMWDQYGDKHKGVCLVFFKEHLDRLIRSQHPNAWHRRGKVAYLNRPLAPDLRVWEPYTINMPLLRQLGVHDYAEQHIYRHAAHLFFEKARDWRDEQEFRWLAVTGTSDDVFVEFDCSLTAVVFGEHCSEEHVRSIVRLAKGGGVQFEQLKWRNAAPWFSFRLDWSELGQAISSS
jgi:hypothetical protein